MMRRVFMALFLASILFVPTSANAQTSLEGVIGGNRSADYQPPTDNPQGSVAIDLQNTRSAPQPVPGQADLSQQNLTGTADLRVLGTTGDPNPNTTTVPGSDQGKQSINPVPHIIIGLAVVVVCGYILAMRGENESKSKSGSKVTPKEVRPEPLPVRKKAAKKSSKKRKSKK